MKNDFERVEVTTLAEWRDWLEANHQSRSSIWLVTYKRSATSKFIPQSDLIDEALCYGWIDSLPRKLDEQRTMLRFSPRNPQSAWSKVNKEKVARLLQEKRMQPAGLAAVKIAKENGNWSFLDDVDQLLKPGDLEAALAATPNAKENFDAFPRSSQRGILEWIKQAKKPETRSKRITETARLAGLGLRANFPEARNA